ncbi:MAG: tRNA 2-selenouridine(34) synthase MnmH, partial [Bacteroidota bacterium]
NIGKTKIPDALYAIMRSAKVVKIAIPDEVRMMKLVKFYSQFDKNELKENTLKITKRLGHLRLQQSLDYLEHDDFENWVRMMLEYYDKAYLFGLSQRNQELLQEVDLSGEDMEDDCKKLLNHVSMMAPKRMQL